jgi:predicted nuclease of predicted toxin-antitoxin system
VNFVADESVDIQIVDRLRKDGHFVWYVTEMSPSMTDDEVLELANSKSAPLITSDKDFGELVFRQHLISYGIILIRLSGLDSRLKAQITSSTCESHKNELVGNFTVISANRIRIRKI